MRSYGHDFGWQDEREKKGMVLLLNRAFGEEEKSSEEMRENFLAD